MFGTHIPDGGIMSTAAAMPSLTGSAEVFEAIVASRRSVRAFRPDPVPLALIERVLTTAGQAPSNCNAQPWVVHIVSGAARDRMRTALMEAAASGRSDPDIPRSDSYVGQYKARRISAAVALFEATGVGRHDDTARQQSFMRNFELFDAPHTAFLFMPRCFGMREAADVGMYAQTFMLALTTHGLGSCAQGAISHYSSVLRRELGVDEELACLFGISFGYPDEDHPSVAARTDRAPLSETVIMHTD